MPTLPTLSGPTNEDELVQRLLARDERAMRQVDERYGQSLLALIRRVVREETQAQDILQEGLLKIWLSIGSYDAGRGRLFTWMVRICCNQAIDSLRNPRNRFHRGTQSLDVAEVRLAPATPTFQPEHIGVRELTKHLKPGQREVMNLLYFGGYTQVGVAEVLDIPLATVKTRVRAARLALGYFAR